MRCQGWVCLAAALGQQFDGTNPICRFGVCYVRFGWGRRECVGGGTALRPGAGVSNWTIHVRAVGRGFFACRHFGWQTPERMVAGVWARAGGGGG